MNAIPSCLHGRHADRISRPGGRRGGHRLRRGRSDAGQRRPGRQRDPADHVKATFVGDKSKTVYGQSGITLKVEVAKGHTWTGTVTYTAKLSEPILVASAEESISGSISYAKTTTVTLGGTWMGAGFLQRRLQVDRLEPRHRQAPGALALHRPLVSRGRN